jgi:hypothetical protein
LQRWTILLHKWTILLHREMTDVGHLKKKCKYSLLYFLFGLFLNLNYHYDHVCLFMMLINFFLFFQYYSAFVQGLHALGKDWAGISRYYVRTRDRGHVRKHSFNRMYKHFMNHI